MNTKPLAVLCWIQVAGAVLFVALNFWSFVTRPWLGFDYSRADGQVQLVVPDSPAARSGISEGERVVSINGHPIGKGVIPLYFAEAGRAVPVTIESRGAVREIDVVPIAQEEMRRDHLRSAPRLALGAIAAYLHFPLHLWMLGLGIALLWLRPEQQDARLAALSLAYWSGGIFIFQFGGFGSLMGNFPRFIQWLLHIADAVYIAGFFALCVHFALVFASPKNERRRWWEFLPYAATAPIFIESLAAGMRRFAGDVRPPRLAWDDAYSTLGSASLLAALVILAVRFRRLNDANRRRRVGLVFLSLLPGSLAFILAYLVDLFGFPYGWRAAARLLHAPATIVGSAIFAYAVVRHRMFGIRVLVRNSLRYALARGTLVTLMTLPLLALGSLLYIQRHDSIAVLLTGAPAAYIVLIAALLLVARYRKRLLEALDRRFFREQYDARRLLLQVVSIIRSGSDVLALSRSALDEIDRALHPKHVSLWQLDVEEKSLRRGFHIGAGEPGDHDSLPADGTLATLLSADDAPLDVHNRHSREMLRRLPASERDWLERTGAYLIVPLLIEQKLAGMMVLGERRSEEPYSAEDRELLRTLGGQLALTLDYSRLKHSPSLVWSPPPAGVVELRESEVLRICARCGRGYSHEAARCEADQQALVPEPGIPRVIDDKYVVTRLLGRGGMGSVYLATQKRLNRPVAIKVLLSHLVGSASMRSRFEREARIIARLRHPAIVTIHDFGALQSGHAYLVMEYVAGETLRSTITSGPQSLDSALPILATIGDAVDAAHRAGVVHRDLKPENIMLVREDRGAAARVLDFGLAKMTVPAGEDAATLIQSGHSGGVVGTLLYMAPEVLSGRVADARSDQYSLAMIAWELLTGEHPLGKASDLASLVRGHTETIVMPVRQRIRSVPEHISNAIARALGKKPEERFPTVADFIAAMAR